MNLICKNDKYGEKNKEYQVLVGDNDIVVYDDKGLVFTYNFPTRELTIGLKTKTRYELSWKKKETEEKK